MNKNLATLAAALAFLTQPLPAGVADNFRQVQNRMDFLPLPLEVARFKGDAPNVYRVIGQGFGTQGEVLRVFINRKEVPEARVRRFNANHLILALEAPLAGPYPILVMREGKPGHGMMFKTPAVYDTPMQMVLPRSNKVLVRLETGRFDPPRPGAHRVHCASQETLLTPRHFNDCLIEAFNLDPAEVANYAADDAKAPAARSKASN